MLLIVALLLLSIGACILLLRSWNLFQRTRKIRKIPRNLDRKDWKKIDARLITKFNPDNYSHLPADLALIEISKWLNYTLQELTKPFTAVGRNFPNEWKKKVSKKVRRTIKKTQYLSKKDCSVNDLYTEFNNWNINSLEDNLELDLDLKMTPVKIVKEYHINNFTSDDLQMAFKNDSDCHDVYDLSFEVIKFLPSLQPHLAKYFNQICELETLSPEWKDALVFCEKKPGERPTLLESVRPLIKLPTMVRLYHKLVSRRMVTFCDTNHIINREIQKGNYRSFSGVQENILIIKEIIGQSAEKKAPLSMLFLDIKNAYGSIKKQLIYHAITHYQFPKEFLNYVNKFYTNNQAKMTIGNSISESFGWNIGIYQGCSLSNLLFLVSINLILEDINLRFNNLGFMINDLRVVLMGFVDDIVLITNNRDDLITIFNHLDQLLTQFGFTLNYNKLRLLETNQDREALILNGHPIEKITDTSEGFKYLGSYLNLTNSKESLAKTYCDDLKGIFEKIDRLVVRRNVISNYQKYLVYKRQILPKIRWILISENFSKEDYKIITDLENEYIHKWKPNENAEKIMENKDEVVEKSKKNIFTLSKDSRLQRISLDKYKTNRNQIEKEKKDRLDKISNLVENEFDNVIDFVLECDDDDFDELIDLDLTKATVKDHIYEKKVNVHTYTDTEEYVKLEV